MRQFFRNKNWETNCFLGLARVAKRIADRIVLTLMPIFIASVGLVGSDSAQAAHNSPRKRGEVRVVVTFKQEFSSTDRQALHLAMKMGFKRHYKSTHSDLVHFSWDRALSKAEARERAQAICKRYLESPLVQSCVPAN